MRLGRMRMAGLFDGVDSTYCASMRTEHVIDPSSWNATPQPSPGMSSTSSGEYRPFSSRSLQRKSAGGYG